ncbi:MAG: DNA-deoxyinosine glycosylase [Clostridiales bacterium]|nr:DNA-deoxyinosine glycosylase [Clostridiales bacterium]
MNRIEHPIPPVYNQDSKILILGSFPSVKSRKGGFFYHHPQNRFWRVISQVFSQPLPQSIDDKRRMLLDLKLALWDVIQSCEIEGSADSSIKNVIPNDLTQILDAADIRQIVCNGGTSHRLYMKYIYPKTGIIPLKLPSTSPANAACSLDKLVLAWSQLRQYL